MAAPWEKYQDLKNAQSSSGEDGPWSKYKVPVSEPTKLDSVGRGLAQGASLGFADEIAGGAEALLDKAQGSEQDLSELYKKHRDESRAAYGRAKKANPKSYGTGEIGGAIGTAFIPGLGAANGAKIATIAGKAALQGGIAGVGMSDEEDATGIARDAARGAVLGGVTGAAGGALANGVSYVAKNGIKKATDKVADKLSDFAELRAANALGATKRALNKQGLDKIKSLGRGALDEGIISPLAGTDKMAERAALIKARGGRAMGEVYDAIDDKAASTFNPLEVAGKVDDKLAPEFRTPINKGETAQLENTLESILQRGDKNISLRDAQKLKQEIGSVAYPKGFTKDVTPKVQMARDAYSIVNQAIDDAASNGAKTIEQDGLQELLKKGKKDFGLGATAEDLLLNRVSSDEGNKLFGLTDTIAGTEALSKLGPAGIPLILAKKVAEKYGNQTLAVGADKAAKMVSRIPGKVVESTGSLNRIVPSSAINLNQKIKAPSKLPAAASKDSSKDREPAQLKGEALWMQKGAEKLGIDPSGVTGKDRQLLIEASDLSPTSKRFKDIQNKLKGMGK